MLDKFGPHAASEKPGTNVPNIGVNI